jgi:dipeptidyl aminopeptidase/acylaminoacyl peptidase
VFRKIAFFVMPFALSFFACQKSEHRAVKQYTIEQFMNTVSIRDSSFSADEKTILFSSNQSGIYNAFTIPAEGGKPTQITNSADNAIFVISFFPHDNRILYSSDKGGNEISHIYLRNEDGTMKDLTPDEKARADFYDWSYDEQSFFYGSNRRDPLFMDFYEINIETFTPKIVYQNDGGYQLGAISSNKRYFAFSKFITTSDTNMFLLDREKGEMKLLSPHEGNVTYNPQTFSPDSKSLYYLTNEDSEFAYLKRYDIQTGQKETVEKHNWDILDSRFSYNGKYRVVEINEDGRTVIKVYDTATSQPLQLPALSGGNITFVNISRSEKLMSFYFEGSKSPDNLFVYSFETGKCDQLTDTMNPEINPNDLVEARVVRYKSYDGLEIPAVFYKPLEIKRGEKAPALVKVHGGPGGQARIGYSSVVQYLVNHGYVVIDVNNRGSSGYGKTFYKMDDKKHGEVDLDDCVWAKKFLTSTGYVDEDKIGIFGGSYGGYMVLAALTFRPEEFAVGVDLFGISNWVRTLQSIPSWWESEKEALYAEMGSPETDLEYLRSISPLFHAEKIKKPLIVLQGANDPRVLKVESDEIVKAAREKGVPVEYIVFEDEGHGFVNKANQIKGYKSVLDFLDKYLKKSEQ